jgi:hypothetical protein
MSLNNINTLNLNLETHPKINGLSINMTQTYYEFAPLIATSLKLGQEIITFYENAMHNKELCGFILKKCNYAMAAIQDLDIRKTENVKFFSNRENLNLFTEFVECIKKMKKFISRISKLNRLIKYFVAASIEDDFICLVREFDKYMESLHFPQSRDDLSKMKSKIGQINEILFNVYEIPEGKQSCQDFLDQMDLVIKRVIEFQIQNKRDDINSFELNKVVEENEPLLDGRKYLKTYSRPGKRTSLNGREEFYFGKLSLWDHSQISIRKEVNVLKELEDSDHIISFYGIAQEDSRYYLVTEWMEHGNLREYYTIFRDSINLEIKIKFALDICRGVAYLHGCKVS